jgi:hypothetical protein
VAGILVLIMNPVDLYLKHNIMEMFFCLLLISALSIFIPNIALFKKQKDEAVPVIISAADVVTLSVDPTNIC